MIIIKNGDNSQARYIEYEDSGDWWIDGEGNVQILLCGMGDVLRDDDAFLLALHELIEAKLCYNELVSEESVVNFDIEFAKTGQESQPGDAPDAPYRTQHRRASIVEHLVAYLLGITDYGMIY